MGFPLRWESVKFLNIILILKISFFGGPFNFLLRESIIKKKEKKWKVCYKLCEIIYVNENDTGWFFLFLLTEWLFLFRIGNINFVLFLEYMAKYQVKLFILFTVLCLLKLMITPTL